MFGDERQELVRFETRHQHKVMALYQSDGECGEAGVVAQRDRDQVDVAVLGAQRVSGSRGNRLSPPASINLGLPVLPPDAIDFHTGDTTSGSGSSDSAGSGVKPTGTLGVLPRGSSRPTISACGSQVQQSFELRVG